MGIASPSEITRRLVGRWTHTPRSLPILVLAVHSRCNCRCLMCDIWKANRNPKEIDAERIEGHLEGLRRLGVRWIVLTGGEPLMHSDLWSVTDRLREELGARLTLLSTGLLLARDADRITSSVDEVIVSLDGPPETHDAIRRVPRAFEKLAQGVAALREVAPEFPVSARSVVQANNHAQIIETADTAFELGLDRLSYLLADTGSEAFNRPGGWEDERADDVGFDLETSRSLQESVERLIRERASYFERQFIAESPARMRAMVRQAQALASEGTPPLQPCNAPSVSMTIEADGSVRPCFFHPPFGHLDDGPLDETVRSEGAATFRRDLDVAENPVCRSCTCRLHVPVWKSIS